MTHSLSLGHKIDPKFQETFCLSNSRKHSTPILCPGAGRSIQTQAIWLMFHLNVQKLQENWLIFLPSSSEEQFTKKTFLDLDFPGTPHSYSQSRKLILWPFMITSGNRRILRWEKNVLCQRRTALQLVIQYQGISFEITCIQVTLYG